MTPSDTAVPLGGPSIYLGRGAPASLARSRLPLLHQQALQAQPVLDGEGGHHPALRTLDRPAIQVPRREPPDPEPTLRAPQDLYHADRPLSSPQRPHPGLAESYQVGAVTHQVEHGLCQR